MPLFDINELVSFSCISFSSDDPFSACIFPDLIKIQQDSYKLFIYGDIERGGKSGLYNTFNSIFPIKEISGRAALEFVDCKLGDIKYSEYECIKRGVTYSSPLRALLRLIVWDSDAEVKENVIKNIKEQEVYIGDIPMMTSKGTFIINGIERVVVSQLHRSPGIFFDYNKSKSYDSKLSYIAKIIPYRGSWLDFEFSSKGLLFFRIDKKKKLPIMVLLKSLGLSNVDILRTFYKKITYKRSNKGWLWSLNEDYIGVKLKIDLVDVNNGNIIHPAGTYLSKNKVDKLCKDGDKEFVVSETDLHSVYLAEDIVYQSEIIASAGQKITPEIFQRLKIYNIDFFYAVNTNNKFTTLILNSIIANLDMSYQDALFEIYNVVRPGESPSLESAKLLFHEVFFDSNKYDLSYIGRMKIGQRFNVPWNENETILKQEDIILTIKELALIHNGYHDTDDIDSLSNRRVRSVGEFIENQLRIGLVRMHKIISEYMPAVDIDTVMPFDLVNSKILIAVIKEFFVSSPLSQFMDQTNPLSEITHKRRLSALGPGGLNRERAGFEVRDVHTSHRGRLCPIDSPEGQKVGLVHSLSTCARINKYGFIEAPYRKVINGVVTDTIEYLSSVNENACKIAQSNALVDENNHFVDSIVSCRYANEITGVKPEEVDYIDLTPKQIVSVAASLIPFLENNDANRALMGSNMQRQAVPLLNSQAALVGTGMESLIARGSGTLIVAKNDGHVTYVNSSMITISSYKKGFHTDNYNLCKYYKSNDNTLINQRPIVNVGDYVKAGDVIADGVATDKGELALGCNLTVAFMSWKGYNFEDSIVISNRVIEDDLLTSIHIEEFECVVRDTRLGPEEITRDIPNIGEEFLCNLDEYGIAHVGAEVEEGDILVGKVTPKSESLVTPEEKLLRAIFGEKAIDMRDTSLYLPPGISGKIIDVRIMLRRGIEHDGRVALIEKQQLDTINKQWKCEKNVLYDYTYVILKDLLLNQKLLQDFNSVICKGDLITDDILQKIDQNQWWFLVIENSQNILDLRRQFEDEELSIDNRYELKIRKIQSDGDDLGQSVLRVIKVFVAIKHSLQPGDKMAGRHGNKGVISKIAAKEDMPYLKDGTPVDIILNSLGIPSRMNIGQVLETHLGWACVNLREKLASLAKDSKIDEIRDLLYKIYHKKEIVLKRIKDFDSSDLLDFAIYLSKNLSFSTPVFESPKDDEISYLLNLADLDTSGQEDLYDGMTGEKFDRKVTVGSIYILKLHHLVDDKMHARSVGPYSLITQQPLGGRSYFGGQRFGEMECWALQAYGASYTLQEMLTIKSDDVIGRLRLYDSIIHNDNNFVCGIPESFYVMVNELRALCLDIELYQDEDIINNN